MLSKRNSIQKKFLTFLFAALSVVYFCGKDYNPFSDLTNAKVHVITWSFSGRDSIPLYSTGSFKTVVALREAVDSFSLRALKNRFWSDTTVRRASSDKILEGGPYVFSVSFFDTGLQTVKLTTFRSNGEILSQEFSIRVFNPLHQENVSGFFGDTIVFSTDKVPDDAIYHWKLGDSWLGFSVSHQLSTVLPLFYPTRGKGSLWVSDLSGNNITPEDSFSYSLNDTSKPIIQCINSGVQGKTILSGDTVFTFKVLITDAANADVESCSVNQAAFDYANGATHVYTKLFNDLPELTKNNLPLTVIVFAMDNQQFRNISLDTFRISFDPGGTRTSHTSVSFTVPSFDSVSSQKRNFTIYGDVENDRGDTLKLSASVNGVSNQLTKTVVGSNSWSWLVQLDTIVNVITVSAYGKDDRLLASAQRVVLFDPNAIDIVKPNIFEISADGTPIRRDVFYTDKDYLSFTIVAFDEGSGIASMIINQDTLPPDTASSYIWNWTSGKLMHQTQGNPIQISAVDNAGNIQGERIVVHKNSIPSLTSEIAVPSVCCVDSTYSSRIFWHDADDDPVSLAVVNKPQSMTVSSDGTISWKPVRADVGKDTLIVTLSDKYETSEPIQWIFTCRRCDQSALSVVFKTSDRDFPEVLQVGVNILDVALSVDSSAIGFVPRYGARFIDNGMTILDNDTSGALRWTPSLSDTGRRQLMVTVGDGEAGLDTLYPILWVVPKNQYRCSLSVVFSGTMIAGNGLDLFSHPKPETLFFSIHDQDHPQAEQYVVTVSLHGLSSVQTLDTKEFFVAIEPNSSKNADTLQVKVLDMTGSTDSLWFVIQYVLPSGNTPPVLLGDPGFPVYFCYDTSYKEYYITSYDPDDNIVDVVTIHAPAGMKVSPRGLVEWTPSRQQGGEDSLIVRFFDQHDSSKAYQWPLFVIDCANKPPAVRFQTSADNFPKLLQTDVDSISIQLQTVTGTGVRPFAFNARFTDKGPKVLNNDTIGSLLWRPTMSDTGGRTMVISVRDRINTADSISPQITIVPRNRHPCSLTYTYSGITLSSGLLYVFSTAQPESALFVIHDDDHPLTEQYSVKIVENFMNTTNLNLAGTNRAFSVKINTGYGFTSLKDTITVSVKDTAGNSDTVDLIMQYPIHSPADVPQLSLSINSSSGVTTQMWNRVGSWSDASNSYLSLSQMYPDRQPTYDQNIVNGKPAIRFEHDSEHDDQGLFNSTFDQWADTPFTVFVVFSAASLPVNSRQTLVSANTTNGFGVGIACDGGIGIFNDSYANACVSNEWASTDLTISLNTWYVATWKSDLGIMVGGNIRVQAWLNGTAASQLMSMQTQSGPGVMVGTGSTEYTGSFDGYIAAIVLYKRALSDDERFLVERYLGTQYGITIQ